MPLLTAAVFYVAGGYDGVFFIFPGQARVRFLALWGGRSQYAVASTKEYYFVSGLLLRTFFLGHVSILDFFKKDVFVYMLLLVGRMLGAALFSGYVFISVGRI